MSPRVAFVVYDGFNELDTFASLHIVARAARVSREQPQVVLLGASPRMSTMYGVEVGGCLPLEAASTADAVVVGSGNSLRAVGDANFMSRLRLDPARQLIAGQCSGALVLAHLGLLREPQVCTDDSTRPQLEAAGFSVLDQPLFAHGTVATAGGCLASAHLATWVLWRLLGEHIAKATLASVAPVGKTDYVSQVLDCVRRHMFFSHWPDLRYAPPL